MILNDIEIEKIPKLPKVRKRKRTPRSHADSAWKEALNIFFNDFMSFCWPEAYNDINWEQGYEVLEQELHELMRHEKKNGRIADKLIKVWRKDGQEAFVLIHIEVQGQVQNNFGERMLTFCYRIYDCYRCPITSLAILTDKNHNWAPNSCHISLWGSHFGLQFNVIKILDYIDKKDLLINDTNPFALVILAQLAAIETAGKPQERYKFKCTLSRLMLEKGWNKDQIFYMYRFLAGLLVLPHELELEYDIGMIKLAEEKKMAFMTTAEKRGHKIGREEGIETGIHKGETILLVNLLNFKFKKIPKKYLQLIENANADSLLLWARRVLTAENLEDIFNQ